MVIVHNSSVWWDMLPMAEHDLLRSFLVKLDICKCCTDTCEQSAYLKNKPNPNLLGSLDVIFS